MLYIIGLGLGDERDITVRGLDAVRSCHKVYVEAYTSLLSFGLASDGLSRMEKLYGRDIVVADREMVEERADGILSEAVDSDVAFLVVGDPFGYTSEGTIIGVIVQRTEVLRTTKIYDHPHCYKSTLGG
ncbi:Tetrapyrrole (Corrin/Porphyrin) Methylases [Musa troglodytarum]|uniref:diphthine methyl ester synthase n=1 Tax=Musa troglodytarum TaxID=320322 RepID=A0A9E7JRR8_9LILI|nr:Tetrapyrrole (Corrin/Porphyrin) Methylases [Musa troglodytarum]